MLVLLRMVIEPSTLRFLFVVVRGLYSSYRVCPFYHRLFYGIAYHSFQVCSTSILMIQVTIEGHAPFLGSLSLTLRL